MRDVDIIIYFFFKAKEETKTHPEEVKLFALEVLNNKSIFSIRNRVIHINAPNTHTKPKWPFRCNPPL